MNTPPTREAVGLISDRVSFERTTEALLAAGFQRTDMSVLSSRESLDAAGEPGKPWRDVLVALLGEIKYEWPLVASGALVLAGGPVAATMGAVIGAATAGVVTKEVLDEVTSAPHTEDFAHALEAGGVILWVRTIDAAREAQALEILNDTGADNAHINQRNT